MGKKHLCKFFMFDIKDIHPSIQEELLNKGFSQEYIGTSGKDREIM